MRRPLLIAVFALAAVLVVAGPAQAQAGGSDDGAICACYDPPPPPPQPPPPPPPPPAPPPPPPADDNIYWDSDGYWNAGQGTMFYFDGTRCKTQRFVETWSQAGKVKVLQYEGGFRVCYRFNGGIVSVTDRWGDATFTRYPWAWKGNADGYPNHVRFPRSVEFHYRGRLELCPAGPWGCLSTKWPWVVYTFYDNNTMTRRGGAA